MPAAYDAFLREVSRQRRFHQVEGSAPFTVGQTYRCGASPHTRTYVERGSTSLPSLTGRQRFSPAKLLAATFQFFHANSCSPLLIARCLSPPPPLLRMPPLSCLPDGGAELRGESIGFLQVHGGAPISRDCVERGIPADAPGESAAGICQGASPAGFVQLSVAMR